MWCAPPGTPLLGGLEQQPHRAALGLQLVLHVGQRQPGAEHHGGVHVVAAAVRDAVDGRGVLQAGAVLDRQGVEVGAQRDPAGRLGRPHVGDDTGPGKAAMAYAGAGQVLADDVGGARLLPGQLRVGVQVAADLDEHGIELGDPVPHPLGQLASEVVGGEGTVHS